MLEALTKNRSLFLALTAILIDIVPGRADGLRGRATRLGLPAQALVGDIERLNLSTLGPFDVCCCFLNRGGPSSRLLSRMLGAPRPIVIYLIARCSDGNRLWAFAVVIAAGDRQGARQAAQLLGALDRFARPTHHAPVFGGPYATDGVTLEPILRAAFCAHLTEVFVPLACGATALSRYAIEASLNGGELLPVVVVDSAVSWGTADELAQQVFTGAPAVLGFGRGFTLAELGPGSALRLHLVRSTPDLAGDLTSMIRNASVTVVDALHTVVTTS